MPIHIIKGKVRGLGNGTRPIMRASIGRKIVYGTDWSGEMEMDVDMGSESQVLDLSYTFWTGNENWETHASFKSRMRIDWGDGGEEEAINCEDKGSLRHEYSEAKIYTIKIKGIVVWYYAEDIDGSDSENSTLADHLVAIRVGDRSPIRMFGVAKNPGEHGVFSNCVKLTSINGDLFNNLVKEAFEVKWTRCLFRNCGFKEFPFDAYHNFLGAMGSVKNELDFHCMYYGNETITSVPDSLFVMVPSNVTTLRLDGMFQFCQKLTTIPETLFDRVPKNLEVLTCRSMFFGCRMLSSVPDGLFKKLPETLGQDDPRKLDLYGMFNRTSMVTLSSALIANIPDAIKHVIYPSYEECNTIKTIPSDYFDEVANETSKNISHMFKNCTGITGAVPEAWKTHNLTLHNAPFEGCVNASNYAEIPDAWKVPSEE